MHSSLVKVRYFNCTNDAVLEFSFEHYWKELQYSGDGIRSVLDHVEAMNTAVRMFDDMIPAKDRKFWTMTGFTVKK